MLTNEPAGESPRLRYGSASVFARADTHTKQVAQLEPGQPFTVLGTEGEFYQVQLPDGSVGFVYAHNVIGSNLPLTVGEQQQADDRAARAAQPPGGWRGLLGRLRRA